MQHEQTTGSEHSGDKKGSIAIEDARITYAGDILAPGRLEFPPDRDGHFSNPEHDFIEIEYHRRRKFWLRPVLAQRDADTGFMISQWTPLNITLPTSIETELLKSFSAAEIGATATQPRNISIEHSEGRIQIFNTPQVIQPLSRWTCRISWRDDATKLQVDMSARLRCDDVDWSGIPEIGNYWDSDHGDRELKLSFSVDSVSLLAVFGRPEHRLLSVIGTADDRPTTSGNRSLQRLRIDKNGVLIARSKTHEWVELSFSQKKECDFRSSYIRVTPFKTRRDGSAYSSMTPVLISETWVRGVVSNLHHHATDRLVAAFEGGEMGRYKRRALIDTDTGAFLDLKLRQGTMSLSQDESGLHFSLDLAMYRYPEGYRPIHRNTRWQLLFTVAWEGVVARFPEILNKRGKFFSW